VGFSEAILGSRGEKMVVNTEIPRPELWHEKNFWRTIHGEGGSLQESKRETHEHIKERWSENAADVFQFSRIREKISHLNRTGT